jgi:hypothetical protein
MKLFPWRKICGLIQKKFGVENIKKNLLECCGVRETRGR